MHRIGIATLACLAVVGAGLTAAARADDAGIGEAFAKRLFAIGSIDHKTYACFVRSYDAAHLAHHPRQTVRAMKLLLTVDKVPEEAALAYSFKLGLGFRNRPGAFDSSGNCGHAGASTTKESELALACSVDCDGGGIEVALAGDDKSLILRLDRLRIWDTKKPDDDDIEMLEGGADDRVFRLDRADVEECTSLVTDREELAAMRRH